MHTVVCVVELSVVHMPVCSEAQEHLGPKLERGKKWLGLMIQGEI